MGELLTVFQYTCTSNKMQRYTVYLHLETALHVSGGTSTHHQEHIQLYLHLVFVTTPLMLSAGVLWVAYAARSKAWVCGRLSPEIVGSNSAGGMDVFSSECCVLSGSGLCDELITRPEESCRLWCVLCVM
jgi:hypothetical protein